MPNVDSVQLSFEEALLFADVAGEVFAGAKSVAKALRTLRERGQTYSASHVSEMLVSLEEKCGLSGRKEERLINMPRNDKCSLTDAGETLLTRAIEQVRARAMKTLDAPRHYKDRIRVASQNMFTTRLLTDAAVAFYNKYGDECCDIDLNDITDINQGMAALVRRDVDLVIDSPSERPVDPAIAVEYFEPKDKLREFRRVALVPTRLTKLAEKKALLTADDLVTVPLCYSYHSAIEPPLAGSKKQRVVVDTLDAVRRVVANGDRFVGISINWIPLLEPGKMEEDRYVGDGFIVKWLDASDRRLEWLTEPIYPIYAYRKQSGLSQPWKNFLRLVKDKLAEKNRLRESGRLY